MQYLMPGEHEKPGCRQGSQGETPMWTQAASLAALSFARSSVEELSLASRPVMVCAKVLSGPAAYREPPTSPEDDGGNGATRHRSSPTG